MIKTCKYIHRTSWHWILEIHEMPATLAQIWHASFCNHHYVRLRTPIFIFLCSNWILIGSLKAQTPRALLIIFKPRKVWVWRSDLISYTVICMLGTLFAKDLSFTIAKVYHHIAKTIMNKHARLRPILFSASLLVSIFWLFIVLIWYLNPTWNNMFYSDNNLHLQSMVHTAINGVSSLR